MLLRRIIELRPLQVHNISSSNNNNNNRHKKVYMLLDYFGWKIGLAIHEKTSLSWTFEFILRLQIL
jgi:hypothetical protein